MSRLVRERALQRRVGSVATSARAHPCAFQCVRGIGIMYDGRRNRDDGEDGRDRNGICCCSQSSEENECGADQLHD